VQDVDFGGDAPQRISLADSSAPINPEQAAEALGALLAARHESATVPGSSLRELTDALSRRAEVAPDKVINTGPYLDRSVRSLAALAVPIAHELDADLNDDEHGAEVSAALTLAGVELDRSGTMHLVGPTLRGDRHLDLAGAAVGLAVRFGPGVVAPFLASYGMDNVDLRRLDLAQMLLTVADHLDVDFASVAP